MKIFIFGDSHTRSFMNRKNIYPFFLGPGKEFNINNDKYNNIIVNINKFFFKYKEEISKDSLFFLYFGEPNCRYLVDNNYHPFKINISLWKNYKSDYKKLKWLDDLINNYDKVINTIKRYTENYFIITPTTGFYPSFFYMNYFNKLLKEKYKMKIINIYDKIINEDGLVDGYYLNDNYYKQGSKSDPIHLNNNISELFLDILKNRNLINDKKIYIKKEELDKRFTKNERFNTYII